MIAVSPHTLVLIYLSLTLIGILGLWIKQHYKSRHKKIVITEKALFVCEFCHYAYMEVGSKKITQCPQCNCYNKE